MSSLNANAGIFDNLNSSLVPINAGSSFIGRYISCLDFSVIDVSVKTDSIYDLKVIYSHDGFNDDSTTTVSVVSVSSDTLFYQFSPKMRYYRIQLNNTDIDNQTELTLQTILKSTLTYNASVAPASNVDITSPLNMDGSVFVGGNLVLSGSVGVNNFPSTQDVNITNASVNVSDSTTQSKLDSIQTQLQKSNKNSTILWLSSVTGVGGVSLNANLSSVNQTNLSFYGNVSATTVLTVQFSQDGTTFYDTQYSYSQTGAGDIGFNIQSSPLYVRLKSSNSVNATIYLNCN